MLTPVFVLVMIDIGVMRSIFSIYIKILHRYTLTVTVLPGAFFVFILTLSPEKIVTVIHINKKKQKKTEWRAKNKQLFIKTSA